MILFNKVCDDDLFLDSLNKFTTKEHRYRDRDFWITKLVPTEEFGLLLSLIKKIFILSHGNAASERGFSINKECIVTNLKNRSSVSQRIIYNAVNSKNGIENIEVTKKMMLSIKNARNRYDEALKKQKEDLKIDEDVERKVRMATPRENW